jgi:hypothetical protein
MISVRFVFIKHYNMQFYNINKQAIFFSSTVLLLLLGSCASYHNGYITGNASLSQNNYRYAGKISATNRLTYLFGYGGNRTQNQIEDLRHELLSKYPLREGLAWANVGITNRTRITFPFIWHVDATITADVIDFWPDTNLAYPGFAGYYLNDSVYIYTAAFRPQFTPKKTITQHTTRFNDTLYNNLFLTEMKMSQNQLMIHSIQSSNLDVGSLIVIKENNQKMPAYVVGQDSEIDSYWVIYLSKEKIPTRKLIYKPDVIGVISP